VTRLVLGGADGAHRYEADGRVGPPIEIGKALDGLLQEPCRPSA
jgi:hypothetical protein